MTFNLKKPIEDSLERQEAFEAALNEYVTALYIYFEIQQTIENRNSGGKQKRMTLIEQ